MRRLRTLIVGSALVLALFVAPEARAQACFTGDTGIEISDCDGDGVIVGGGDCADDDASVHPGVKEVCADQKDNDCDGLRDEDPVYTGVNDTANACAIIDNDGDGLYDEDDPDCSIEFCDADFDMNGVVDVADLTILLANWGTCDGSCPGDANGDGMVDTADLVILLNEWGTCPD